MMQQPGMMNGFPQPGQVPLLVGASPFQQHLSALQGLANAGAGTPGLQQTPESGGFSFPAYQLLQGQNQPQQQQQTSQQPPNSINQPAMQQQQTLPQQSPQTNQPQQSSTNQTGRQQEASPAPVQQNPVQPQQDSFNPFQNAIAGFNQNALMAAAMGSNMGFNLQQLQQLQMAQQLIAAGLPPNLAFAGMQQPGASIMNNPLMLAGLANPMMAQFGGLGVMGNPMAALGMAAANTSPTPGIGFFGMNGMAPANPATSTNPIIAAGLGALKQDTKSTVPVTAPVAKTTQPDWAEPFAGKGKKEPPFPLKLHQILSNPEFQECICWNPHGRSWRILKPPVFEQLVIPLYFRHAKYASFMRQVNGWGFKRIVSGNDHNSYYHELFLRDYPQLCLKMKRIRKGEKATDDDSDGDDKQMHKIAEDFNETDATMKADLVFHGADDTKKNESGHEAILPRGPTGVAGNDNAQTLASLGLSTGSTGLTTAAPGYSALVSLQEQLQNVSAVNAQNSGLSSSAPNAGLNAHQPQYQAAQTPGMSNLSTHQNMGTHGIPVPGPTSAGGAVTLDNSAFWKLQEALQSGSLLQQQNQQPVQTSTPAALNLTNLNFLQGPMGGALAAQLQAATQAPSRTDDSSKNAQQLGQTNIESKPQQYTEQGGTGGNL
ncbi:hypothetical protein ACA910_021089 [Epithemia clementina (nom. ined.)]